MGFIEIEASDLPNLSGMNGKITEDQISADGLTGMVIQDIGSNTLGWRYPNHIAGPPGFLMLPNHMGGTTAAAAAVAANNRVMVVRVQLPHTITVSSIVLEVTTAVGASQVGAGLYDPNGNRMIHTGAVDSASTGVKSTNIDDVAIMPGTYWWAWTASDTGVLVRCIAADAGFTGVLNGGTAQFGRAANASVAGVLPATLGAITTDNGIVLLGKLQG